jgi:hypothetical protein
MHALREKDFIMYRSQLNDKCTQLVTDTILASDIFKR